MSESSRDTAAMVDVEHELDAPINWREIGPEDYVVFVIFWILALDIFAQFFTRYVLNDSLAWTEEIARYLLIGVTFVGSITAVRKNSHIMVEFLFRFIPPRLGSLLIYIGDVGKIAFFAYTSWACYNLAGKTLQMMVSLELPKSWMYYMISVCLAAMAIRAVQVLLRHIRQGGSQISLDHARHVQKG
ncbi:TRAP transporter small permease [Shumkonia mesophila]|uniref:TRAP transporter small permease n=1 Tax=Shumkonia mesophila TaxID=2838854 RepID=UPI0029352BEE|nr:TRAP transporter small permease [Shumkonia mesophila]